jgi:hypothetical protein
MLKDTLWIRQVQLDLELLQPGPSISDVVRFQIGRRHVAFELRPSRFQEGHEAHPARSRVPQVAPGAR